MTDGVECPTCGKDGFDDKHAMRVHHATAHDESIARSELECEQCGETFTAEPGKESRKYCSVACSNRSRRTRVTIECKHCGDEFEVPPSMTDRRTCCSRSCASAYHRSRVTLECEHCGDGFETIPSKATRKKYCSKQCQDRSRRTKVELTCENCDDPYNVIRSRADESSYCCESCKYEALDCSPQRIPQERRQCVCAGYFHVRETSDQRYCCHACRYEDIRVSESRPDTLRELLVELYCEKDRNLKQTFRRANVALQSEDRYSNNTIKKRHVRRLLKEWGYLEYDLRGVDTKNIKMINDLRGQADSESTASDDSWRDYYQEAD